MDGDVILQINMKKHLIFYWNKQPQHVIISILPEGSSAEKVHFNLPDFNIR